MRSFQRITFLILFQLVGLTSITSQNNFDLPPLIINEIGYSSADDKTFIELLVLGSGGHTEEIVDISGWIIDNYSDGNKEDEFMIRLGPDFAHTKVGAIIIIYDPKNPFREFRTVQEAVNDNSLYHIKLVPIDSDLIEIININDFQPVNRPGRIVNTNWRNTIGLTRANNGLFVSNPQGVIRNGIAWTNSNNPLGQLPNVTNIGKALPPGLTTIGAGTLCPSDHHIAIGIIGTPGFPNNTNNSNSSSGNNSFSITCGSNIVIGTPPQGRIDFLGGISPYEVEVKSESGVVQWAGTVSTTYVLVGGSLGRTYTATVIDGRGCKEVCSYSLPDEVRDETTCEGQSVEIGEDTNAECFKWEPTLGLEDPNASLTKASPSESTTYTLIISDGCGQITSRKEYQVKVDQVDDVEILSNPDPAAVSDEEVILSVTGEWQTYQWSAPTASTPTNLETFTILPVDFNNGLQGTSSNYSVIVTDDNGCTNTANINVGLDSDGDGIIDDEDCNPNNPINTVDTDGDGFCDEIDCDPNSILIGGIGSPCNDYNSSTINDVIINDNCDCVGTPDGANACNGNDQDGDGICDADDSAPFNACIPNGLDTDGDGICDQIDCDPNEFSVSTWIGQTCDDGNISTIHDQIDADCNCNGIPDPNYACDGNDSDGDGICDTNDPVVDDPCNELSVNISGDLTLCSDQNITELTAEIEGGIPPYTIAWNRGPATTTIQANISQGKDYSVTITDFLGCSVEDEVTLIQYYEPYNEDTGKCEDEPCEVELPASNVNFQVPPGLFSTTASRNDYDCDQQADCITAENGHTVCATDYVPIKFKNSETCSYPIDPLQVLVDGIGEIMDILEERDGINRIGSAAITSSDFLCHCETTNDALIQQYEKNVRTDEVGIWINFVGDPDSDEQSYEVYIIGFDPIEFPVQDYLFEIEQTEDGVLPTGGLVHTSQLKGLFDPQPTTGPYGGTDYGSLVDYANLDPATRDIILANANLAESRFGVKMKFITSADCISIINPDESLSASSEKAKAEFEGSTGNGTDPEVVYWLHKNAANQIMLEVKINGNIILNNALHQNVDLSNFKAAIEDAIYEVAARDQKPMGIPINPPPLAPDEAYFNGDGSEWTFGFRNGAADQEKNFFGITKAVAGATLSSFKQGQVDEQIWRPDGESLFDIMGLITGPVDGFLETNPVASCIQIIGLVKSAAEEPEVRQALWQAAKHPIKTTKEMFEEEWSNASGNNGKEQQHYTIGKLTTTTTIGLLTGTGFIAFIQNLPPDPKQVGEALAKKVKDFPKQAADQFYERVNQLIPNKPDAERWLKFMEDLGDQNWHILINNPDLLNIWVKFKDLGTDQLAKFEKVFKADMPITNPVFVDKLKEVFLRIDNGLVHVQESIVKFVDDLDNGSEAFKDLFIGTPEAVKAWDVCFDFPNLRTNTGALDAVTKHRTGEVVPLPSTYLDAGYISNHLAQFDNGGSYLVPTEVLDQFGRNLVGRPDGQFIAPAGEIDDLLAAANGNISVIEDALGIPSGAWQGKQLSRIDIPSTSSHNRRLPSGNEAGANENWIPGGVTSGGKSEAIVDQIPIGSYTETVIN